MKCFLSSIILTVVVFVSTLQGTAVAAETENGIIEGKITNGTAGGGSVAGREVKLKTYRNNSELTSATTSTDTEGRFVFYELDTDLDYSYQATVNYQEADYLGDYLTFDAGQTKNYTEITVYQSTMNPEALKVITAYTVIYTNTEMGGLCIDEYFLFTNESDRTYIGSGEITVTGNRKTLSFALLNEATELQYGGEFMQCCLLSDGNGFSDTMPLLPGNKELFYSYHIDNKDTEYGISLPVNYPMVDYALLVESQNVQINGSRLAQTGPDQIQDSRFTHFIGTNLVPGDKIEAQIFGLLEPPNQNSVIWVLLVLFTLIAGFTYFYIRGRRKPQPVKASFAQQEESLLKEIARLDDEYEDGKIEEKAYRSVREHKKMQLSRLKQKG